MRAFVEEAAGISRYKDRRRETENRISHTRENLERLNDLREEVDKQIRHLQRQAGIARRYQESMTRQRQLQADLLALRIRDLDGDIAGRNALATQRETETQAAIAELRARGGGGRTRTRPPRGMLGRAVRRARPVLPGGRRCHAHRAGIAACSRIAASPARGPRTRHDRILRVERAGRARPGTAERAYGVPRAGGAGAGRRSGNGIRGARVAGRVRIRDGGLATALGSVQPRFGRSDPEFAGRTRAHRADRVGPDRGSGSDATPLPRSRRNSSSEFPAPDRRNSPWRRSWRVSAAAKRSRNSMPRWKSLQSLREAERQGAEALDAAKAELQSAQSELMTVEAVQKAALGRGQTGTEEWLARHKLDRSPRLAQQLEVEKGWERAVETSLGSYLEAVCVEGSETIAEAMDRLNSGQLTITEAGGAARGMAAADTLLARVSGPAVVTELLAGVIAVDSLADALARRLSLLPGQSVITRAGIWIGRTWLRVARSEAGHAGVIEREQDLQATPVGGIGARKPGYGSRREAFRNAWANRRARYEPRRTSCEGQPPAPRPRQRARCARSDSIADAADYGTDRAPGDGNDSDRRRPRPRRARPP